MCKGRGAVLDVLILHNCEREEVMILGVFTGGRPPGSGPPPYTGCSRTKNAGFRATGESNNLGILESRRMLKPAEATLNHRPQKLEK